MAEAKRRTDELKSVTDDKAIAATAIGKAAAAEHRLYNLGRLVSAWIWDAALGNSQGPWWALTVIEPQTP